MMNWSKRGLLFVLIVCGGMSSAVAQGAEVPMYNPNSIDPIANYEMLYKQTIWRRVDLREKQNKGLFAVNREFSKILLDAVADDKITNIYWEDSLDRKMTKAEFVNRLYMEDPSTLIPNDPYDNTYPYYEGDIINFNGQDYLSLQDNNEGFNPSTENDWWQTDNSNVPDKFFASQISWLEIKEDMIFDKRRGRLYYDIHSIKLIVPGENTIDGSNKPLAAFAYKDLEKFFRENPDRSIWYNQYNSAENRNLADAFLLRLFRGYLYKVENPDNLPITSMYDKPGEAVQAAQWLEMQMLEREHNLWEY